MTALSSEIDHSVGPTFFTVPYGVRPWLERHHGSERELWVGFHRKSTGRPSLTCADSVDEAVCIDWINDIRRSVDAECNTVASRRAKAGQPRAVVDSTCSSPIPAAGQRVDPERRRGQ